MDRRLSQVVERLSAGSGRVCFLLDHEYRLAWVSPELRGFLGVVDDAHLGVGSHIVAMGHEPAWRDAVTPDSHLRLARAVLGSDTDDLPRDVRESLPAELVDLLAGPGSGAQPVRTGSLDHVQPGLPPYPVEFVATSLRDRCGELIGTMVLMYLELRPSLVALLGRGDTAMYERMALLTKPERRATAILFADLQASGELSRALSTAAYFGLISDLTARFDALVAEHGGIVGKHAGDGWTAFVLAQDVGGPSAAAAGCLEVAQRLRAYAVGRANPPNLPGGMQLEVNSGVHWGPGVYLGQLVPGGWLEVTALGDEVNGVRPDPTVRPGRCAAGQQAGRGAARPRGRDTARRRSRPPDLRPARGHGLGDRQDPPRRGNGRGRTDRVIGASIILRAGPRPRGVRP
ncbi:MAG TPA: adenylate/guanylate cyclase domain-containing protein [Pseudonocardia sp.]|jgi:class 3 adenylate cyclase